jgi:hypothetical protein
MNILFVMRFIIFLKNEFLVRFQEISEGKKISPKKVYTIRIPVARGAFWYIFYGA